VHLLNNDETVDELLSFFGWD